MRLGNPARFGRQHFRWTGEPSTMNFCTLERIPVVNGLGYPALANSPTGARKKGTQRRSPFFAAINRRGRCDWRQALRINLLGRTGARSRIG